MYQAYTCKGLGLGFTITTCIIFGMHACLWTDESGASRDKVRDHSTQMTRALCCCKLNISSWWTIKSSEFTGTHPNSSKWYVTSLFNYDYHLVWTYFWTEKCIGLYEWVLYIIFEYMTSKVVELPGNHKTLRSHLLISVHFSLCWKWRFNFVGEHPQ